MSPWRKTILLFVIVLILYAPAGCWSRREINELTFVKAVGLDRKSSGGTYRVTIQVARVEAFTKEMGGKSQEKNFEVYTATGSTPAEAIGNLSQQLPRRLLLSDCRLIVISEKLATAGMKLVLDFFARNQEFRGTAWLLITRGEARDLLKEEVDMEKIPPQTIANVIKYGDETSRGYRVNLNDFLKSIYSPGVDPVAASVDVLPRAVPDGKPKVSLGGIAVFRGDRLVGWLDERETRGSLWVVGKARKGMIVVNAPGGQGKVTFEFLRAWRKLTPEIRDGSFVIKLKVDTEGVLAAFDGKGMAYGRVITEKELEAATGEVERGVEAAIRDEVRAALRKAQQEYRADIFGFGQAIHRRFPQKWQTAAKRWNEIYPTVKVQIEVDARLRASGLVCHPRR